jgi:hypothetical protein
VTRPRPRILAGSLVAGLLIFAAPVLWILLQQGLGALSYFNCAAAAAPWGGAVGIALTLACVLAACGCWISRTEGTTARRFLMVTGAGSAAIFALAALTLTIATFVVPACAR